MRRRLGRSRRSHMRHLRAFAHPPGVRLGGARSVGRPPLSPADEAAVDAFNGHPVLPDYGPGPAEAVAAFLRTTSAFVVDPDRERFLMTLNPCGYLRRIQ